VIEVLVNDNSAALPLITVLLYVEGDVKTRGMGSRGAFNDMLSETLDEQALPARLTQAVFAARKAVSVLRTDATEVTALAAGAGNAAEAAKVAKELDSNLQDIVAAASTSSTAAPTTPESLEPKFARALFLVGKLQALSGFPAYDIPTNATEPLIPQGAKPLATRAWVDVTVRSVGGTRAVIRAAVDGYNTPVAGGRFMAGLHKLKSSWPMYPCIV
jgi:hypothetical protein